MPLVLMTEGRFIESLTNAAQCARLNIQNG
jgi:hypothetical protein